MRVKIMVVGALLGLGIGCGKKEPKPPAAPPPVAAADLKLELGQAPEVKLPDRINAALLGMTLEEFQGKWGPEATKSGLPATPSWDSKPLKIIQYATHSATVSPDLTLQLGTLGDNQIQEVRVVAKAAATSDAGKLLATWNTVMNVLGHQTTDTDHRRVLEGLGLTTAPTAKKRRFDDQGMEFQVEFIDIGPTLTFSVAAQRSPLTSPASPFTIQVPTGVAPGAGKLPGFSAVWDPGTLGKTFQDGVQVCRTRGLYPCTEPQWSRTCTTEQSITKVQTWTTTFTDGGKAPLAFGGQPGCGGGDPVASSEVAPNRGVLCCTRSLAMPEASESNRVFTLPILAFEQGVDLKDGELLTNAIASKVVKFYTVMDTTKEQVVKMSLDYARNEKGFWTIHESCSSRLDENDILFLRCRRSTFFAGKAMVTEADYAPGKEAGALIWITDPIIRRGKAAY